MAEQFCKKCGKELHWYDQKLLGGLCTWCGRAEIAYRKTKPPISEPGQMAVVRFKSTRDYEKWVKANGSEVEIINVLEESAGFFSGGGYVVTYRRK